MHESNAIETFAPQSGYQRIGFGIAGVFRGKAGGLAHHDLVRSYLQQRERRHDPNCTAQKWPIGRRAGRLFA